MQEFKMELRVDYDNPEKYETIREAMREAAKHVLTTAMLIQDKRKPQIMLQGGDWFEGAKEISLADDLPADQ